MFPQQVCNIIKCFNKFLHLDTIQNAIKQNGESYIALKQFVDNKQNRKINERIYKEWISLKNKTGRKRSQSQI